MRVFVDTNLWIYRLDQREPEKSHRAARWLRETAQDHTIVISTQVLIEFRCVLGRKLLPRPATDDLRAAMHALASFEVVATDRALVLDATELAVREQLSWFDALIVEAAVRARCGVLYSEDLGHERQFGHLTVVDPLRV